MLRDGLAATIVSILTVVLLRCPSAEGDEAILTRSQTPYNTITMDERTFQFTHPKGKADISWGLTLPEGAKPLPCQGGEGDICLDFYGAKVILQGERHCQRVMWSSTKLPNLKDCLALNGSHWYGGGEQIRQPWPIEKVARPETPYVTADMLQNRDQWYGGVSEPYWISSQGVALLVNEETPLFLSLPDDDGDGDADRLCLRAARQLPFSTNPHLPLRLGYVLCSGDNVREVHERTFPMFFAAPSDIPDERMFEDPIWSTWAEYKEEVNDKRLREFTQGISSRGFDHSQVEIDDNWETCYGDLVFNAHRFPDPRKLVADLHNEGFRVTLWIHPFVNDDCDSFKVGDQNGYFLKNANGQTQRTSWWQGRSAGLVDFSNPSAVEWWTRKLNTLKDSTGIDSFKFDAGETSWMPKSFVLDADERLWPNVFSEKYVEAISKFGGMIETRVGRRTQEHPVFVRMLDKDSVWDDDNGLRTLVPSLLHFGLIGYPFVLPDMIGGNSYAREPSEELFLRWTQANTFMPALQFSLLPWRYGDEMTERCKRITLLHKQMAPLIIQLAKEATAIAGTPIIRPTWWLCPESEACLTADQQFLLGDRILVAPIVDAGTTALKVILPPGTWRRADIVGHYYQGPDTLILTDINLDSIVYFTMEMEKEL